jgi:hypothetical protein
MADAELRFGIFDFGFLIRAALAHRLAAGTLI